MASAVMVQLHQMVDLAIGTPEAGSVNFNILHTLLHVLIQQVDLRDCNVEFRGSDGARVQSMMSSLSSGPSLKLTEYQITDTGKKVKKRSRKTGDGSKSDSKISMNETVMRNIEARADSKDVPSLTPDPFAKASKTSQGRKPWQTVVFVEKGQAKDATTFPVTVSHERFLTLERDLENVKNKLQHLTEIANNAELMDAVRQGKDSAQPIVDMWQIINLNKRVEATETGVEKLASMIEDLIKEIGLTQEDESGVVVSPTTSIKSPIPSKTGLLQDIVHRIEILEDMLGGIETKESKASTIRSAPSKVSSEEKESEPSQEEEVGEGEVINKLGVTNEEFTQLKEDLQRMKDTLTELQDDLHQLATVFEGLDVDMFMKSVEKLKHEVEGEGGPEVTTEIADIKKEFDDLNENYNNKFQSLSDELHKMEYNLKDLADEYKKLNKNLSSMPTSADEASINDLFMRLMRMQDELETTQNQTNKLMDENDERQMTINALVEQIDLLKTIKADREDLEDALQDKADALAMNRKVSHDQFDAACDDLTRSIEEALNKLANQEAIWTKALEDMTDSLGGKLDKGEFDPLREFVNRKIKSLQDRVKALIALKREQEAAGTKSRMLRDVNCISCDKVVVMNKINEFPTIPLPQALAGTKSMRPYLTYELDAVRKQQRVLPQGRNLNYLETAIQENLPRKEKSEREGKDHLCNRYCGGSHTTTTAQQRVARHGHFLTQWGPEAVPLPESQVIGKDGHPYKGRDAPDVPEKLPPSTTQVQLQPASTTASTQQKPSDLPHPGEEPPQTKKEGSSILRKQGSFKRMSSKQIVKVVEPAPDGPEEEDVDKPNKEAIKEKRKSSSARVSKMTMRSAKQSAVSLKGSIAEKRSIMSQKENVPPAEGGEISAPPPSAPELPEEATPTPDEAVVE